MRQILEGVGPACFGRDHWQALGMREPMANFQKNLVFDEFCNTTLVLGRDGVNIGIAHHGTVGLLRRLKKQHRGREFKPTLKRLHAAHAVRAQQGMKREPKLTLPIECHANHKGLKKAD
jgi:hypothetical protein